ncbi:MAG: ribonuclease HII [Firmicutes bacterium]|nr:ribonuclease HII [Bacillota bacterium]
MRRLELNLQSRGYDRIIGIDEAGRGPLAGPVVAAAVQIVPKNFSALITDSKQLSPKKRKLAYEEILSTCFVGVGMALTWEIDQFNILEATFIAMRRAIQILPFQPGFCLVDGPLPIPELGCPQKAVIGGDGISLAIAAASIVAKVERDELMKYYDQIYPGYGFHQNKGYGTKAHRQAILEKGSCPQHRFSFRGVV